MIKIAAALLIGVGIGLGVASGLGLGRQPTNLAPAFGDRAPLERRLSKFETSLALERKERQVLADALSNVRNTMVRGGFRDEARRSSDSHRLFARRSDDDGGEPLTEPIRELFPYRTLQTREEIERIAREEQINRFAVAGIAPEYAQAIMRREDELEMEVLLARHAAIQAGATPQDTADITPLALLRKELGDTDYAKYLEARGRTNSISVGKILANSAAAVAGLRPGDEIVAYDGQRVFDVDELIALTRAASLGTTVPLQVVRDGQPFQVYIEAGPIGAGARYGTSPRF